jgi:hypothetical protein
VYVCTYVPAAVTNITTPSTHKFKVARKKPKKDSPLPKALEQFRILPNEKFMSFSGHPIPGDGEIQEILKKRT